MTPCDRQACGRLHCSCPIPCESQTFTTRRRRWHTDSCLIDNQLVCALAGDCNASPTPPHAPRVHKIPKHVQAQCTKDRENDITGARNAIKHEADCEYTRYKRCRDGPWSASQQREPQSRRHPARLDCEDLGECHGCSDSIAEDQAHLMRGIECPHTGFPFLGTSNNIPRKKCTTRQLHGTDR